MSYVEKHLIPGETLQYQTKLHWHVMFWHVAAGAVFALVGISFMAGLWASKDAKSDNSGVTDALGLISLLAGALFIGFGFLKRRMTEMAVTNKRVIVKMGLVSRRTIELLLSRIESIVVDEPAMGRLLGYGSVTLRGTGGTPEVFENVSHPLEFRAQVQRQIEGPSKQE